MASGAGVSVAHFQYVATPDVDRDPDVARRPEKSLPVWNSRTTPLSDVLRGRPTPTIVRDCGRRDDVVARRDVYVHSLASCNVVVADGLTADPRRGLVSTGRRHLIPVDHRGWFELLSQDGHAATPIGSVQHLMTLASERCLVRQSVVGLSIDDGVRRTCRIVSGETLSVEGVATGPGSHRKYLRCRLDSTGQSVLLPADKHGQFSPVAGPKDVSGVHRMRSVVAKFRFPVVVRLVTRCESSSRSSPAFTGVTFRVTAMDSVPAAYVVPLWLVNSPSVVERRSLLWLPTSTQASSVLDSVTPTSQATAAASSENWTEMEWSELRRRCDELIKSRAVTAEITRLFPTAGVDDRQRIGPVASSTQPQVSAGDDDFHLLREIDRIYEAIKVGHARVGKNGVRTTAGPARQQVPRRYRSVRQDTAPGASRTRSPPQRRSGAVEQSKAPAAPLTQYSSAVDLSHVHSQPHLNGTRQMSPSPVRLRRVTSHVTSSAVRRHSSPPPQPQHLQLYAGQHDEPVYEELTAHLNGGATQSGAKTSDSDAVVTNGQYVVMTNPSVSNADNLRQVIKRNNSETGLRELPRPAVQSRRWSVALASEHGVTARQLQVFDDLTTTNVKDVEAPPTQQVDSTSAGSHPTPGVTPPSDTVSRSVSSGRLTSSSSDDVTPADRKSSSALAAVTSTLKRALRRHTASTELAAGGNERPSDPIASVTPSCRTAVTQHNPSRHADDAAVTSQTSSDVIALALSSGGKVTYF